MKSRRTREFHELYDALPAAVRRQADKAYAQFASDPNYAGLNFKSLGGDPVWYSARIGIYYRVLCRRGKDGAYVWCWIGTHRIRPVVEAKIRLDRRQFHAA